MNCLMKMIIIYIMQHSTASPNLVLHQSFSVLLLCSASSSSRHYTKTSGRPGIRCRPGRIRLQMVSQKRLLRQDRPGRTSRSAHISINCRGFQGRVKIGFTSLRQASGPDLRSPEGQTRAQMEQKTHSLFLLFR